MKSDLSCSVIIPAYNAEKYLEEAVQSVLTQNWTVQPEIIVVDNHSDDHTAEIAARLPVITLYEERRGAASARNKGISAALREWIVLLDADDRLESNAIELLSTPLTKATAPEAIFGKAVDFISPELSETERMKLKPRNGAYGGVLPGCSLIKKTVFERIGVFDTTLSSGETIDWVIRLRNSGIIIEELDSVVLNRRIHMTNTGRMAAADELTNYAALLRKQLRSRKIKINDNADV